MRRLLQISWTEHKTNVWVRLAVNVKEEDGLLATIKRRKISKYGHWKRRPDSVVLAVIEGEVEGRNKRGRRRINWFDNIPKWTGKSSSSLTKDVWKEICQRST